MEFEGVKTAVAGIKGYSTINHRLRVELGLNMTEYAVAIYLWDNYQNSQLSEAYNSIESWKKLGLRDIQPITQALTNKGILTVGTGITFTTKWAEKFNIDDQFDKLFKLFLHKGNKQDAKKKLEACLKIAPFDVIYSGAEKYMKPKSKETSERHFIKSLEAWLNPKLRHWEDVHESKEEKKVVYKRE